MPIDTTSEAWNGGLNGVTLRSKPLVRVGDDFEDGNLEPDGRGGHQCTAEALQVLQAFGTAISRTGSPSRILITSRYDFPVPTPLQVVRQPIGYLQGADLKKKLRLTKNLGPFSPIEEVVRTRAITAAAGIPRAPKPSRVPTTTSNGSTPGRADQDPAARRAATSPEHQDVRKASLRALRRKSTGRKEQRWAALVGQCIVAGGPAR